MTFALDRAGVVGEDGPTHTGSFDIAFMRTIPNMVIATPSDEKEMWHLLNSCYEHKGPAAVRYPRGSGTGTVIEDKNSKAEIGKAKIEWHQDWAFYPHTNDDLITVGVYLEDCDEENGPLQVIPKSHKKKIYNHHNKNKEFVGKICEKVTLKNKTSLIGKAGTVTFHHVRTVHGSGLNLKNSKRPLMLFGYTNNDAFSYILFNK